MKKYLGIVGMPASGKSTALKIAKEFGEIFAMGDVVRNETQKRGLERNSKNLGMIAKSLREEEGNDVIAVRTMENIKNSNSKVIIIDGIRSMHEVNLFNREFPLEIIAILAIDEDRHKWILLRKREDDSNKMRDILERDNREIGFGIQDVIKNADYTLKNNGTIEELENKCKDLFKSIIDKN